MTPSDIHFAGEKPVLQWRDAADVEQAPRLRRQLLQAIAQHRYLTIDLHGITRLDSAGVAVLVEGLQFARARGGDLRLQGANAHSRSILSLTRLDQVFGLKP